MKKKNKLSSWYQIVGHFWWMGCLSETAFVVFRTKQLIELRWNACRQRHAAESCIRPVPLFECVISISDLGEWIFAPICSPMAPEAGLPSVLFSPLPKTLSSLLCEWVLLDSLCFRVCSLQQDWFICVTFYEVRRCIWSSSLLVCRVSNHWPADTQGSRLWAVPRPLGTLRAFTEWCICIQIWSRLGSEWSQ